MKDAKVENYAGLRLGYLPVAALTIRQIVSPTSHSSQSLTLELLKGEKIIRLDFTDLRQLRLADLHPGSICFLNIVSVADHQMEGIRYQVFNDEQDLTLDFYCADFAFSA
jgi:hypothetical protein